MKPAFDVPTASTVFCDDLRTEDNGKQIYIGVYTGYAVFPAPPPRSVPVLALRSEYLEPVGFSTDALRFTLVRESNGEVLIDKEIQSAGVRPSHDIAVGDTESRLAFDFVARLSEVVFERDDRLRARWYVGERMVHAGSFLLMFETEAESSEED